MIKELHEKLKKKKVSAKELAQDAFKNIADFDSNVHAFITVTKDYALSKASEVDDKIQKGEEITLLSGIPFSAKDAFCAKGIKTTGGSKILDNYISPYSSTVVSKIEALGGVLIGKTNCDPFGHGSSTENSDYGTTHNPWDLERVPGGSSGGSAAAVAAQMCVYALGEDTGGSIRQPASFTNTVGLKVTYGRISRYGVLAYASSLDTIGPITQTVEDAAIVLEHIAGHDKKDSTTPKQDVPKYSENLDSKIKGLKIGIPKEYFAQGLDEEVQSAAEKAIKFFKDNGAEVKEVSIPHTKYAIAAYYLIATSETSSNLARYDGIRYGHSSKEADDLLGVFMKSRGEGFGPEAKRRIMLGTYALSSGYYDAYYKKAQKVRTLIKRDFEDAFGMFDLLIAPASPYPAFKIGEKMDDPLQMYLADVYTVPISLAGVPAISVPCGFTSENLPIGMQIIGKQFDELTILQAGHAYEKAHGWHNKNPSV